MTSIIRVLSEQTINQIAAGEVIENPASVVKELVENSIDAGASQITVEIRGGGLQLIRVIDDGLGMSRDDAILSLERYATSKIRKFDDLLALGTMGFRGEALASIASISKVTLATSLGKDEGTSIEVEGGKLLRVQPCARTHGTTIDVRSLFYNVPARKKFQKSAAACSAEITRLMTTLSLAHPGLKLELISNESSVFSLQPDELGRRAAQLLGEEFLSSGFPMEIEEGAFKIRGLLGGVSQSRPNRSGQYLFINRRAILCPAISFAVRDGYGTRLEERRHPSYVLHLEIPCDSVDINVHPQKREVRLRDEPIIKEKVKRAVAQSLAGSGPVYFSAPRAFDASQPVAKSFAFDPLPPLSDFVLKEERLPSVQELPLEKEKPKPLAIYEHYLLLEQEALILVDLLAARARLIFESLLRSKERKVQAQALLIPITLELSIAEMQRVIAHLSEIEALGIGLQMIRKESLIIDALPPFLEENSLREMIGEITAEMENWKGDGKELSLARLASRFARSSKKRFMLQEGIALYEELLKSSSPHLCPLGKTTMVYLGSNEITNIFKKTS